MLFVLNYLLIKHSTKGHDTTFAPAKLHFILLTSKHLWFFPTFLSIKKALEKTLLQLRTCCLEPSRFFSKVA
jgi:hypothetical protein